MTYYPKWHIGRTPKEFILSVILFPSRTNRCVNEAWEHFWNRYPHEKIKEDWIYWLMGK